MNTTTPQLVSADYVGGYVIRLRFEDDSSGVVDLEQELWGEVFEPLRAFDRFREFRVDLEANTIVWPNGADFAPEFLYARACKSRQGR
jgi:hypothetical protein